MLLFRMRLRTLLLAVVALSATLLLLSQARMLRVHSLSSVRLFAQASDDSDNHEYVRPPRAQTSGFPNSTATYHRAPCPCLNTLANHGYLPRDGKNLTPQMVKHAIVDVFSLDASLADMLTSSLPPAFTLADLGEHNFIEHDASLVHNDAFFKTDPSEVNATLAEDLFSRAGKDQVITKRQLAHFRADREKECKKSNPEYSFGVKRQAGAYAEAAAFLLGMGDYESETISIAHARSFLVDEKFPDDFKKSDTAITTSTALYLAAQIKFLASLPWLVVEVS
jgi:hypothetical protein